MQNTMKKRIQRKWRSICAWLVMLAVVSSCTGCGFTGKADNAPAKTYEPSSEKVSSEDASSEDEEPKLMDWEDALLLASDYMKSMTLEEKVGQLFMVNLEQLDDRKGSFYEHRKYTKKMQEMIQKYHVGGAILFSRNIYNREQTQKLTQKLCQASRTPLFIGVDEEGGAVARIANNCDMGTTTFPTMEEIGKTKEPDYTYEMAKTIGAEIGELGFNVDFAPVADVKTSELNREIGSRSFGDDADKVAEHVSAFVQGLEYTNMASTLKHFPGQGSSKGDTHRESVNIDSSIAKLRKDDFVPFEEGISAGADFIMVSHISVSKVTESSVPASMSELIMQTILREELGFKKLIITDAMDMASITDNYTSGQAAYRAFKGGADIILMPKHFEPAYKAIYNGVLDKSISMKRLEDSVVRILAVKIQHGIMTQEQLHSTPSPTVSPTPAVTTAPKKKATAKKKAASGKKTAAKKKDAKK